MSCNNNQAFIHRFIIIELAKSLKLQDVKKAFDRHSMCTLMAWNVGIHSYSRKNYNVHSLFEMPKEISRDPPFFVKGFNLALYKKEI